MRTLILVLLLCGQCLALTKYTDTLKGMSEIFDATICSKGRLDGNGVQVQKRYTNYGAQTTLGFSNNSATSDTFRAAMKFDLSSIPAGALITSCSVFYKTSSILDGDWIYAYPIDSPWVEGSGVGTWNSGFLDSGVSWTCLAQPGYPATASTIPRRFDWRDSSNLSSVKNQGPCGSCFVFGASGATEGAYKIELMGDSLKDNWGDGVGADRMYGPSDTVLIDGTGWDTLTVFTYILNGWARGNMQTNGLALYRTSGEYTFNSSEAAAATRWRIYVKYNTLDTTDDASYEREIQVTGTTETYDTYLDASNPTTNTGADTSLILSSTKSMALLGVTDFLHQLRLGMADSTHETLTTVTGAVCSLYTYNKTTNGSVAIHRVYKTWLEDQATWNQWRTNYEWGTAGCMQIDELDMSERQLLSCDAEASCIAGGSPYNSLIYWLDNSRTTNGGIVNEATLPYDGVDTTACQSDLTWTPRTKLGWVFPVRDTSYSAIQKAIMISPITGGITPGNTPCFASGTNQQCYVSTDPSCDDGLSHIITVVGWDSLTCGGTTSLAWLIRNSWGFGWKDGGYAWVKSGADAAGFGLGTSAFQFFPSFRRKGRWWAHDGGDYQATRKVGQANMVTDGWQPIAIDPRLVQDWLTGVKPNNGLMLIPQGADMILSLHSSEAVLTANQPFVRIDWVFKPATIGRNGTKPTTIGRNGTKPTTIGR